MDYLLVDHQPDRKLSTLLIAFSGWADAAEGATSAGQIPEAEAPGTEARRV